MSLNTTFDPYTTPFLPPPQGQTSHIGNPQVTKWPELLAVICVSFVITIPITVARVFTKLHIRREFKVEDYVVVSAQIAFIGYCICYMIAPVKGVHGWDLSVAEVENFFWWSNIRFCVYVPTVLLAKNGILLQLERVFSIVRRDAVWWAVRIVIWLSTIFYTIGFFLNIFACSPREKIWNPTVPGTCLSFPGLSLPFGVFNILTNFSILVLPLPVIGRLKASLRKRIMIGGIFGVVVFALIASIVRTIFFMDYEDGVDRTYIFVDYVIWAIIEIASIIFASSFPIMPRFIRYLRGDTPSQSPSNQSPTPRLQLLVPDFSPDNSASKSASLSSNSPSSPISPLRAFFRRSSSKSADPEPGFAGAWARHNNSGNGALGPALTPRGQRRRVRNWYDVSEVMETELRDGDGDGDEKKEAAVEVREVRRSSEISSDMDGDVEKGFGELRIMRKVEVEVRSEKVEGLEEMGDSEKAGEK